MAALVIDAIVFADVCCVALVITADGARCPVERKFVGKSTQRVPTYMAAPGRGRATITETVLLAFN